MKWKGSARFAGAGFAVLAASCSTSGPDAPPAPHACAELAVDPFKELLIVDDAVLNDPRSSNALDGPWSFHDRMLELAGGSEVVAHETTMNWLRRFGVESKVNLFPVSSRVRTSSVLICPWLQRSDSNRCNADCSSCEHMDLDLRLAPFRLIAIANRLDLAKTQPLERAEARFVYALTDGPADDASSAPLKMTVVFEYAVPSTQGRSVRSWADRWHMLGAHQTFDADYRADLAALMRDVVSDRTTGGGPLAQVRTNDRELDWDWSLRQFEVSAGALVPAAVTNTPDRSLNATRELATFVLDNEDQIRKQAYVVPVKFVGGNSSPAGPWALPRVPEDLRKAFARNTCDGCHMTEESVVDINFHISPFRSGMDRLSQHLRDPRNPQTDELARRAEIMREALCGR